MTSERLRRRAYERYREARLETSPWQDYLIAAQLATLTTVWRLAECEAEGTGYRNDHTRGYWPEGPTPDEIIDERIRETTGWRRKQLRYSRIVGYLLPMVERHLDDQHHAVLWDDLLRCLVETAAWWWETTGYEINRRDMSRDYRLPPWEVVRTVPGGIESLNERAGALTRGDPPLVHD